MFPFLAAQADDGLVEQDEAVVLDAVGQQSEHLAGALVVLRALRAWGRDEVCGVVDVDGVAVSVLLPQVREAVVGLFQSRSRSRSSPR